MTVPYDQWVTWMRCLRKRQMSQLEANRHVLEAWQRGDGTMRAYACDGHYHVGHERMEASA